MYLKFEGDPSTIMKSRGESMHLPYPKNIVVSFQCNETIDDFVDSTLKLELLFSLHLVCESMEKDYDILRKSNYSYDKL
jgi:hypothetical protein